MLLASSRKARPILNTLTPWPVKVSSQVSFFPPFLSFPFLRLPVNLTHLCSHRPPSDLVPDLSATCKEVFIINYIQCRQVDNVHEQAGVDLDKLRRYFSSGFNIKETSRVVSWGYEKHVPPTATSNKNKQTKKQIKKRQKKKKSLLFVVFGWLMSLRV